MRNGTGFPRQTYLGFDKEKAEAADSLLCGLSHRKSSHRSGAADLVQGLSLGLLNFGVEQKDGIIDSYQDLRRSAPQSVSCSRDTIEA